MNFHKPAALLLSARMTDPKKAPGGCTWKVDARLVWYSMKDTRSPALMSPASTRRPP